jgi:hypothetical protein
MGLCWYHRPGPDLAAVAWQGRRVSRSAGERLGS